MFRHLEAAIKAFQRINGILSVQARHLIGQDVRTSGSNKQEYFLSRNKILPYAFGGARFNLENIEGFNAFADEYRTTLRNVFEYTDDGLQVCLDSLRIKNLTAIFDRCSEPLKLQVLKLISLNLPQAMYKNIPEDVLVECRQFYSYCQNFALQILISGNYSKKALPVLRSIYRRGLVCIPLYGSVETLVTSYNYQAEWDLIQFAITNFVDPDNPTAYNHKGFLVDLKDDRAFNKFSKFYKERLKRIIDGEITELELIDVEGIMRIYNEGSTELRCNIIDLLAINLPSVVAHICIADDLFYCCIRYYDRLATQAIRLLRNEDLPVQKRGAAQKIAERYICRCKDIDGEYIQTVYRR